MPNFATEIGKERGKEIFRTKRAFICGRIWLVCVGHVSTSSHAYKSVENWKRRTEIVSYCVGVVDKSMAEKRQSMQDQAEDSSAQRRIQAALYADEVKVRPTAAYPDHIEFMQSM
jgi:hypothetical protein